MNPDQIGIKLALISVFTGLALFIVIPGRGQRGKAVQRLAWLTVILLAVVAVAFPDLTTWVAHMTGVGRGTDLLFYGLVVVFIGFTLLATKRQSETDRALTKLARKVALLEADLREFGSIAALQDEDEK
ncbi:MAG: DUF2304 domain-containing protein [Lautropia sp.]|nr:DUF2304 domain-containing protein [Lautropia sp.]